MEAVSRLSWRAAKVVGTRSETPSVATLTFDVPDWAGHLAGQHLDLRLTAPDGYRAERSYSIASAPDQKNVEITVEKLNDGEISPFLVGEVTVGDILEVRGPIGDYFTWVPGGIAPLLLVAGGSGIVPLMAMLRHRAHSGDRTRIHLLYSSRTLTHIIYREELASIAAKGDGVTVTHTLTREQSDSWKGGRRRIDQAMLAGCGFPDEPDVRAFICGPTTLVEQVSTDLIALGYAEAQIKTERFGPTGESH